MTAAVTTEPAGTASVPPTATTFLREVAEASATPTRLELCIQCGTCGGSCPSAADMDHTPRQLFAMVRAGMRDEVLRSNTPWMCVSCHLCAIRCPQEIRIPDVMAVLKSIADREGTTPGSAAPDFSRTFIGNIDRYGRSYEMGLVAKHYLRHYPLRLPGMAPAGISMLAKGRMSLGIRRIRQLDQLKAILERAGEQETQA